MAPGTLGLHTARISWIPANSLATTPWRIFVILGSPTSLWWALSSMVVHRFSSTHKTTGTELLHIQSATMSPLLRESLALAILTRTENSISLWRGSNRL